MSERFRTCHCGKALKDIGHYPLDGYTEEKFASEIVYACEDGHKQHLPRYEMKNPCPTCGKSEWGFALIGNGNSEHKCGNCGFRVVQMGYLNFYKTRQPHAEGNCLLCNADSLILERAGNQYLYKLEKDESLDLKMAYESLECGNCGCHYIKHKCPYCSAWQVSQSEERERRKHGRGFVLWQHLCHCHNCQNEWYLSQGWSD